MIDKDAATAISRSYLSTIKVSAGIELVLLEEKSIEKAFGWIFFYNSRMYVETGDYHYAIAGNAPLIVDKHDGGLHITGTARSIKFFIEQHERRRGAGDLPSGENVTSTSATLKLPQRPFAPERRRTLLDEHFTLDQRLDEFENLIHGTLGSEGQKLVEEEKVVWRRCSNLEKEYAAGVPVLGLSCCPFTGQLVHHSVDHFGLDGLWWNYQSACRPVEQLPETCFALAGALRLAQPPPLFPFLCRPGPELPYVVPRMLRHPAVKAVLSTGSIGEHQGYAITYFARPVPYDIPRINTWGTHCYKFIDEKGSIRFGSEPDKLSEFDFDLAPWISNGKLFWIAPGDTTLTLRDTLSDCPYIGLEGRREITYIQKGRVWW